MNAATALQLLVEAIDAQTAASPAGGYVKLDWIGPELADARAALTELESVS